jgi:RNA polymerase sigma factor (sigma-70 family)
VDWDAAAERCRDLVWSVVRGRRLSAQDAEDAFQNAWLSALDAGEAPDHDGLPAWLASIASAESRRIRRRRRVASIEFESAGNIADAYSQDPLDVLVQAEEAQAVREAMTELRPRDRLVLTSRCQVDGPESYAEIARRLNVAESSVGRRRHRAVERLREAFERRGAVARRGTRRPMRTAPAADGAADRPLFDPVRA